MGVSRRFLNLLWAFFLVGCSAVQLVNAPEQKAGAQQTDQAITNSDESLESTELESIEEKKLPKRITDYCSKIEGKFKKYKWGWNEKSCEELSWVFVRTSVLGDPLMWLVYGNEVEHKRRAKDATMILCGVHGDEITPIKFCFDVISHLEKFKDEYKNKLIVVAPIVNPDSFFKRRPTRTNQRKIDINRNFPTKDWHAKAIKMWKSRYRSDKRRYPGKGPLSEPETLFQVNLIKRYNPSKIISVHAPFTLLDYDGPGDQKKFKGVVGNRANQLLIQMSKKAKGYRVKNYPFFPGSLGNWAGNERKIPTYTLELPSSDYTKTQKYWALFQDAIQSAILHDILPNSEVAMDDKEQLEESNQGKN